jgi:hypothetical protein
LHRQAVAAGYPARPAQVAGLLRKALALLDAAAAQDRPELLVRVLVGLARAETGQDRCEVARQLLTRAAALTTAGSDPGLNGLVHGQRGALLLRLGRAADAVAELDLAVQLLGGDRRELAMALLDRAAAHRNLRQLDRAVADADRCLQTAAGEPGMAALAGMARHQRGCLTLLAGELPVAIRELATAREELVRADPGLVAFGAVSRAQALRAAGLLRAADAELAAAMAPGRGPRRPQELAELELERAEVALLDGRPADAQRWARRAGRRLRRAGERTWAALAGLLAVRAAQLLGATPARVATTARALAERLQQAGLAEDTRVAQWVAARAALAGGQRSVAIELARAMPRPYDRISTRMLARLVRAELATERGARAALLRAGLGELHRYQSGFGGLDLRPAQVLYGRRLAELGLRTALADGRPSGVLGWSERFRALAARLAPMRPPADPRTAELVAELRAVHADLRVAARQGRTDPALHARRVMLDRQVRTRARWSTADGAGPRRPVRLGELRTALDDGLLVSYLALDGRLYALTITARHAQVTELGALAPVAAEVRRARADLDALALPVLPERLREVVRTSLQASLRRLDAALWWPLPDMGEVPVVVVPTGALTAVPWTSLPGLRRRLVTIAPSATWWVQARSAVPAQGRPVFVAGPGLARAETEVRIAAAVWPATTVLTADRATPSAVLAAAAHSPLLHIAACGVPEPDSPLFSALELAGGALFGHELPAATLPPHVVLSVCELTPAPARPGDETLGMTVALLHGGAASVVSGVGRLADAAACEVMVAYHRELRAGQVPAAALARALAAAEADRAVDGARADPAPLVCFGAGW